MMLVLYFQDFELSFHESFHLDAPSPFEAYIRPPIVSLELTIFSYPILRTLLSFLVFSLLESALCLWTQVHSLVDSRVEEVSSVDSDSNHS